MEIIMHRNIDQLSIRDRVIEVYIWNVSGISTKDRVIKDKKGKGLGIIFGKADIKERWG